MFNVSWIKQKGTFQQIIHHLQEQQRYRKISKMQITYSQVFKILFHIENNCHTCPSYNLFLANTSVGHCTEKLPCNSDIKIIIITRVF
jgi:hypothetical protein